MCKDIMSEKDNKRVITHLLFDTKPFDDLVQRLPKAHTIVGVVEASKANQRAAENPVCWRRGLYPVRCDGKIAVCIAGLPCVARQADFSFDGWTLQMHDKSEGKKG